MDKTWGQGQFVTSIGDAFSPRDILLSIILLSIIGAAVRLVGNLAWDAWRLSQANDSARRGPVDLGRRMTRTLLESDHRAKI